MKKALSIILCLAMLVSAVPMSVFAAPVAVTEGDSAFEVVSGETQENAELAEETYTVIFRNGFNSKFLSTVSEHPESWVEVEGTSKTISNALNPKSFYEPVDGENYEIKGWTDGTNVYNVRGRYTITGNATLIPNVVPKGDAYEVTFSISEDLADCYTGPAKASLSVNTTLDLSDDAFALSSPEGFTALGWKNKATGELVETVSGTVGAAIELVAVFAQKTGIVIDTPAKAAELAVAGAAGSFDGITPGLRVEPTDVDPSVTFGGVSLNTAEFSSVEVTYVRNDALDAANGGEVYFVLSTDADVNFEHVAAGEFKSQNGDLVTYKYDLSANDAWNGTCVALRIDPYNEANEFIMTEIQFVKNDPVDAVEITGLTVPATSGTPDVAAEVPADANYTVDSITWAPAAEYFKGSTVYTATIVVAAAEGYMFTDATTFSLNGEAVEADATSLKATIVKEFAATEAPVDVNITLASAAEITENDGTLELAATVTPVNEGDAVAPTTVTWAITGGDEGIATLEGNVLTAKFNGTVKVTATPDYDASQAKEFDIVISGQTAFAVNYDKNTGAEVANMPENTMVKGAYSIPAGTPAREGYYFEGWMTVPEDGEVVSGDYAVTEDVTFYAKWSKGGYFNSFDNASDRINSDGSTLITADGNHFATDLRYASEFTANSAEGYASLKFGGSKGSSADHRVQFTPQSQLDISGTDKVVLGFRTNYSGTMKFDFWYATKDADGNWIAKGNVDGGAEYIANHFSGPNVTTNGDTTVVYEYVADMSRRPLWDGFLHHVRIGNPDAAIMGSTMYYEYIKIPGAESVEHIALNIDAPVAADVAYGLEAVTAGSDKYVATGITWGGSDLLGGMYFDSAKAYTAKVELSAAGAYALSEAPATVTVNGEEAAVVVEDGKIFVVYTFDATEDIGVLELVDITLHEQNDDGAADEVKQVFKGRDVDMTLIHPTNLPSGHRWLGWSETEGGDVIDDILNTDVPKEYYALYELITEYDFSNKYHKNTDNVEATDGLVSFDSAWTVVTPKSDDSAAALTLDGMYLDSSRYDYVEVIYDGSLEDANNANKFSETFAPALKVWGAESDSYNAVLVKAEPLVASKRVAFKYTYDIEANGKPVALTAFELAPYKGKPAWAVTSVKLIENKEIETAVAITDITSPDIWAMPDVTATASDKYEIVSVDWSSEGEFNTNGSFATETEYTVTVVVKPVTGYTITVEDATINGEAADSVSLDADGNLTVVYTFPATDAFTEFELSVEDVTIDQPDVPTQLVAKFTPEIDNMAVTWEVVSGAEYANVDAITGVVTPLFNGEVVVKATSKYNPAKTAQATISISNQVVSYTITYDKNTTSEAVTNMPEDAQAKLNYVLAKDAPVREGFIFIGWAKSPSSETIVEKDYVTSDTTYYAKWSKDGYVNSFDDEGNVLTSATRIDFADGGSFRTDARYMSELTVNSEEGYVSTKLGGTAGNYNDYRMNLYVPAGEVDISNIKGFYVGLRSDTAGSMPFLIRYATKDAFGNWIGPDEGTNVTTYIANSFWTGSITFSGDVNEVEELYIDMTDKAAWDGFLDHIRFCINSHTSMLGATIYFDYFRTVNYETSEVEIKDVVAPVAKAAYSTSATAKDTSKYTVTNVAWEGDLLYHYYFGGSTEYTACVTVKGVDGYFMSDAPTKATINGKPAEIGEYNTETGELTIKYTFPATGPLASSNAFDLTLNGMDDNGEYVEEVRTIFDGEEFKLGSYQPISTPSGKRWIGWETEDGTAAPETIVVDEDMTFYAVFEDLIEFDYSNPLHQVGTEVKSGTGTLVFEDGLAVVTPASATSAAAIITPSMNISGADFGKVEVYYDSVLEAKHGVLFYENIFSATLRPTLYFSLTSAPGSFANSVEPSSAERVVLGGHNYFKYTYDMSVVAAWAGGDISKLQLNPYTGYPYWGIGLIKLVPNEDTSAVAEFEVAEPETWTAPSTVENLSDEYEVLSTAWTPASAVFAAETEYTLTVNYKPVSGYKVAEAVATINGEAAAVTDNGNGTYTANYTFPATEALVETEVVITGPEEIKYRGRYIDLKAETVALDGTKLPVTGVTWSIESVDTDTELARISNGRVFPLSNGTVLVTATSVYDPSVSETHPIEITNQADLVAVTFDKNTQADVTGMPEAAYAYGSFDPNAYIASLTTHIKRDGFYLVGWSKDPDALTPDETFNITEPTTLYAKWGKGFELNFNDAANGAVPRGANTLTFADGIGTLTYKNTSSSVGQAFHVEGLRAYELEASVYKTVEIRLSSTIATSFLIFFRGSDGVSNEGYTAGAYQYNTGVGLTRNTEGKFETLTIDFSGRPAWTEKPYLNNIRFDFSPGGTPGVVLIDYIRIPNNSRTVTFNGNGGFVPYLNDEVASYKKTTEIGSISLPGTPVREGYDFLGWAKVSEADDNTKLYKNKFNVTDDVILYAIWGPEGSAGEGSGSGSGESDSGYSSSEATATKGDQTTSHPGHMTYPSLGGGTVSAGSSFATTTPTDKKVSVPARPKDDGPLAMGAGNMLPEKYKKTTTYDGRFTDIKRSNWFYNDVDTSFELGLMNGKSAYEFAPEGTVTVAEAVTVAARMNAIYYGRQVYGATGAQWYVPYVEYAIANSIIKAGEYSDYKAPATREQVAMIFIKALPASWYPKKNMFSKIPDIAKGSDIEETLLKLYNAGIVTGVDDSYNFKPSENIKRSELSAIINRVALPDSRLRVVTEEEKLLRNKTFTAEDIIANAKKMTVANSTDKAFKLKNGGAWAEPSKADPWSGGWHTLFEDGFVNADEFKIITVVIKPDDPAAVVGAGGSKFYFAFDGKYSDAVSVATQVPAAAEDGTITLVYDMSQHAMWAGEVTTLRYDPYDNATPYAIVSITFAPKD